MRLRSEEEQARDRYKEDEIACRKIFEVMEMENIEQKQLIRLGKREEYKNQTSTGETKR